MQRERFWALTRETKDLTFFLLSSILPRFPAVADPGIESNLENWELKTTDPCRFHNFSTDSSVCKTLANVKAIYTGASVASQPDDCKQLLLTMCDSIMVPFISAHYYCMCVSNICVSQGLALERRITFIFLYYLLYSYRQR